MDRIRHKGGEPMEPVVTNYPHLRHREDVRNEGALPDLYKLAPWTTQEEACDALHSARTLRSVEEYHSESLIITRVLTDRVGTYFVVVESDCVFPEDIDALEALGAEVGEPWRLKVVETDFYGRPHPALPMSSNFRVHVVHPLAPEAEPRRTVVV